MKKLTLLFTGIAALMLLALATPSIAAEKSKGKEITVTGEAKCAMCALKESDKCQTVIEGQNEKGKTVKYYVADNAMAKELHPKVCKGAQKVTATGTVKKVKGKNELTLTAVKTQ